MNKVVQRSLATIGVVATLVAGVLVGQAAADDSSGTAPSQQSSSSRVGFGFLD